MKWKSSEGKLVLKITDNVTVSSVVDTLDSDSDFMYQCLKFKTYSSIFLNRFEALNLSLMQKMQNRRPPPTPPPPSATAVENRAASPETRGGTPIPPSMTPGASTVSAGGVKKKKPKKKK